MDERTSERCRRTYHVYTKCNHTFISPSCSCCAPIDFHPTQAESARNFSSEALRRHTFKSECPECILDPLQLAVHAAELKYEAALAKEGVDLLGEGVKEAYQPVEKARAKLSRKKKALLTLGQIVEGWERWDNTGEEFVGALLEVRHGQNGEW